MLRRLFSLSIMLAVAVLLVAQTDEVGETAARSGMEWSDIEIFEQNRLHPRVNVIPYDDENDIEKLQYQQSSSYILLDEGWRVDYTPNFVDRAVEIESKSFSPKDWQSVEWPDVRWLLDGKPLRMPSVERGAQLPEDGNLTASFYTEFDVPKEWSEQSVFLQLQPLSACYIWVNQAYVGYTEDGRALSEFDITQYLQPGKRNNLTLQMISLSTSNLLDMNRDPRHLGMPTDVALCIKPAVHVQDYALRADYRDGGGTLSIDFTMANRNRKGRYYAEIEIWNPQGRQVEKMGRWFVFDKRSETPVAINRELDDVLPWSAESPSLYTLVIRLLDEKMGLVETVGTRFGFRSVEVSDGRLKVNGKTVTLKGIVYADYTLDADGVVDYDLVEEDLKILKSNNINAIRTAVYSPADPRFYELCDQYGFYVVCDANLHPYSTQNKAIATDNAYEDLFVSRVLNMYGRFKNQTCIIAWSLGESSDNGVCMMSAYRQLKMRDASRPVFFAGAGYGENTDVVAIQGATPEQLRQYSGRMQSRPLVMLGYGSSQGNSMGGLENLWQQVMRQDNIQGGFFTYWNDVSYKDVESGVDCQRQGLMSSSRTTAPGLSQLSYLYRPFDVALRSLAPDAGEFSIENLTDFCEGQDFVLEYNVYTSLKPTIISGEVSSLPDAGSGKIYKLMLPKLTLYAGEEMFIRFSLKQRKARPGLAKGIVRYSVQFPIPMKKVARQQVSYDLCQPLKVEVKKSDDSTHKNLSVTAIGDYGSTKVDLLSGEIVSYVFHGRELLKSPIRLNFWRVPTDNDLSERSVARLWQQLRPDNLRREVTDIAYHQIDENSLSVDMMLRYSSLSGMALMDVRQTLLLLSTGDILISSDIMATDAVKGMARVGLQMGLSKEFSQTHWMGGDIESYTDRCGATRVQSNKAPTSSLFYRYGRPQESGTRSDVRWVALRSERVGLFCNMPDTHFFFSAYPYGDLSMSQSRDFASLQESDAWTFNMDVSMSGIGSAIGGLDVPESTLAGGHKVHFLTHLCAYDPFDYDPFDFCRTEYPKISSNVLEMPVVERDRDRFDGPMTITITSPDADVDIRYTLDGSDPLESSPLYTKPFVIENTTIIKARAFRSGDAPSFTAQLRCDYAYITSVVFDKKPNTPYNHNASKALFDGEKGDVSDLSIGWIGFSGGEIGATFQLSKPLDIEAVSVRFAHNPEAWIFAPKSVTVYVSYDGESFIDWVAADIPYQPEDKNQALPAVHTVSVKADYTSVKAVRIVAEGIGRIPDWHRAKGLKPWLMVDEVSVKERMK